MSFFVDLLGQFLEFLYRLTGDYGLAIIAVTVIIKTCLLPFDIRSRKSMKEQQKMSAQLEQMKKKYRNNEKKLQEESEKLMRQQGKHSLGCLMMILPFPVMYCLFRVIRGILSEELTSFLLPWIPSLLLKDPYGILTVLTVAVQMAPQLFPYIRFFKSLELQKNNLISVLILMGFNGFICISLPAGVGLYYLVSGTFAAVEQFVLNVVEVRKNRAAEAVS